MQKKGKQNHQEEVLEKIEQVLEAIDDLTQEDEWIKDYYANDSRDNARKPLKYQVDKDYYEQFWKSYLMNQMVIKKIEGLSENNGKLESLTLKLEELYKAREDIVLGKQKKKRRTSSQIDKVYKCLYSGCSKSYGCDVAMNLHIKLKHKGGNKTEREELARAICEADIHGEPRPESHLNFPPNYLENFRQMYLSRRVA